MHGNRIKETSTSTGTGPLTTAGAVTGFRTINSEFGNDTDSVGVPFAYVVEHDSDGSWEAGIGYLSDATTLVRDWVQKSSNSDAAVNFASGGLTIGVTPLASTIMPPMPVVPGSVANDRVIGPAFGRHDSSGTSGASTVFYQLIDWPGGDADALVFEYASAPGATTTRMALYTINPKTGFPGKRIVAGADCTTLNAGFNFCTFTQRYIPPGFYYSGLTHNNSSASFRMQHATIYDHPIRMGYNDGFNSPYQRFSESGATCPATASATIQTSRTISQGLRMVLP